jgi:hypothetical protein
MYNGPNYPVTVSMTFETLSTMAGAGAIPFVDNKIAQRRVILFTKSFCPDSKTARKYLDEFNLGHDNLSNNHMNYIAKYNHNVR